MAMSVLETGLTAAEQHAEALTVQEAELSMLRRVAAPEIRSILAVQNNLACTYLKLGRLEEALGVRKDVYYGRLKIHGIEHSHTIAAAINYAGSLKRLGQFKEARSLLRKTLPAARRVLGDTHEYVFRTRSLYAEALYEDDSATLNDLREAVATLEETARTARRVLGGAHPITVVLAGNIPKARAILRARETPPTSG